LNTHSKSKSDARRLEAKRKRSEHREHMRRNLLRAINPSVVLIWLAFYVTAVVIMLPGRDLMSWRLNETVKQNITARVDFDKPNELGYQQDLQDLRDSVPPVFASNAKAVGEVIRSRMTELLAAVKAAGDNEEKRRAAIADQGWKLDDAGVKLIRDYALTAEKSKIFATLIDQFIDRVDNEYIVGDVSGPVRTRKPATTYLRGSDGTDNEVPTSQLVLVSNRERVQAIADTIVAEDFCPAELRSGLAGFLVGVLCGSPDDEKVVYRPVWRYDENATKTAIKLSKQRIDPDQYVIVKEKGDLLVRAGKKLEATDLELLELEHEAFLLAQETDPELSREKLLMQLGLCVLMLVVTVGLMAYTASYQPRIFQKPGRSFALAGLILLMVGMNQAIGLVQHLELFPYAVDAPGVLSVASVVVAALLLTISYDQRFALGAGGALVVFISIGVQGDFGLFLTLAVAVGVTVFCLREIRTRSKIIAVGVLAGIGAGLTTLATDLLSGQELNFALLRAIVAAIAAVAAGFFVQGIMPGFEKVFGVATSMTLLEWCDASKPLLRRLAQEAPGTYSHSLTLSHMVEEAAESIGARGLLVRVGALYHDIGKLQKSEYFIENQEARMNRHDRLSPTMSLLVIFGHVKDGVEMARAYGVPRILYQFIAEHHGTTVVKYFHHAATEAAAKNKGKHGREVAESEFRYPGPKPRSKESAILMVCDTCEGAVRALSEPTPGRVESTVHQMMMERLNDGQFDDCDITLKDLKLVEASVVKSLCAIHHGRIQYPKASRCQDEQPSDDADNRSENGDGKDEGDAERAPADQPTSEAARQA